MGYHLVRHARVCARSLFVCLFKKRDLNFGESFLVVVLVVVVVVSDEGVWGGGMRVRVHVCFPINFVKEKKKF